MRPLSLIPRLLFAAAGGIGLLAPTQAQVWESEPAPGFLYRMEVRSDPALLVVGLRLDPAKVKRESLLTLGTIFRQAKANGRDTVSGMVERHGALGGINGDFFQWGNDPGGDPSGMMARGGELLSLPGAAARSVALAWGPTVPYRVLDPVGTVAVLSGGEAIPIRDINSRTDPGGVTLSTEASGEVYGPAPLTAVRILMPALRLTAILKAKGRVLSVERPDGRLRVGAGEIILSVPRDREELLAKLQPGSEVELDVQVPSWNPMELPDVMGGGPELLKGGVYVGPPATESFSGTRHPRTAVGLTPEGLVWHVVIDGRQAMSVGASLPETAEVLKAWGCTEAINLDGGGSSALHLLGATLNRPSGGVERFVANGIGFFAPRPPLGPEFKITGVDEVNSGSSIQLSLDQEGAKPIWSCQGAAWIRGDGVLTALQPGKAKVTALLQGRIASKEITVLP